MARDEALAQTGPQILFSQMRPILKIADREGVEVPALLTRYGLPADADTVSSNLKLPLITYFRIKRDIARTLDDLTANLSERKLTYDSGKFLLSQLATAGTLKNALYRLAEYYNILHGGNYNSVHENGDYLELACNDTGFPYQSQTDPRSIFFFAEIALIQANCMLDSLSDGQASRALRKIHLVRRNDKCEDRAHLSYWPVPVRYGMTTYKVIYDHEAACQAMNVTARPELNDRGMYARVIDALSHVGYSHGAQGFLVRIHDQIMDGCERQEDIASSLGVSTATLRRRLAEENTSFRDMLLRAKMSHGQALLAGGQSIAHVSDVLGYSDIRAFNRAFKKWFGATPAAYSAACGAASV